MADTKSKNETINNTTNKDKLIKKLFANKNDIMEITGYAKASANNLINEIQKEIEAEGGKAIQGKVPLVRVYKKLGLIDERMQEALMTLNPIAMIDDVNAIKSIVSVAQSILSSEYQPSKMLQH